MCVCVGDIWKWYLHVWRRPCVSLSVVVPTPRLVCVLCALSAVSLRLCAAILCCWTVVCLLCSPGRCVGGENLLAIAGYCCDELHYIYHCMSLDISYYFTVATCWNTCTVGSLCLMWVLRCGCFSLVVCTHCLVSWAGRVGVAGKRCDLSPIMISSLVLWLQLCSISYLLMTTFL